MKLEQFRDLHDGSKMLVCGLGPSLLGLMDLDVPVLTMGVNDIHRYIKTDYVALLDTPKAFGDNDRAYAIRDCKPWAKFINDGAVKPWLNYGIQGEVVPTKHQRIRTDRDMRGQTYDPAWVWASHTTSVFLAIGIAIYMGAKDIGIIGMDLHDHSQLKSRIDRINGISVGYQRLAEQRGARLRNLNPDSGETTLEKGDLYEFVQQAQPAE